MSMQLFDLRGVRPTATKKIHSLASLGFLLAPESVKCKKCGQRYLLMIDFSGCDPTGINAFEKDAALERLTESVTLEHMTGHESEEVALICELHLQEAHG
jgi:hypothetical protein